MEDYVKLGSVEFSEPKRVSFDVSNDYVGQNLTENLEAVYILRGDDDVVLYVGWSSGLKKRLDAHLRGKFKDEIKTIEYIAGNMRGYTTDLRELEKILIFVLKPKYSKTPTMPRSLHQMYRKK